MWNKDEYSDACEHFEEIAGLSIEEQDQRLAQLRIDLPRVASCLQSLLESDRSADADEFLNVSTVVFHPQSRDVAMTSQEATVSMPTRIGSYDIHERIGAGGMGIVYKAFDTRSERYVALKVVRSSEFATHEQLDRFRAEARAAAKIRHPNIVPVYEVGNEGEQDYFTMAYIDGSDLKSVLRSGPMDTKRAVVLMRAIAEAVECAHNQGIVHRDIKPANVLIDGDSEPLLSDFGVAKRMDLEESPTSTGQMMGSIQYAAPEQLDDAKRAGPTADIYSIGATLYECLTGIPPFQGSSIVQVMAKVKQQMPPDPILLNDSIDEDLAAICMQCLEKSSEDRYSSVRSLIEDLERYLRHEPVSARAGASWRRVSRLITYESKAPGYSSGGAVTWVTVFGFLVHLAVFADLVVLESHILLWSILGVWLIAVIGIGYIFHWSKYWQLLQEERLSGILQATVNLGLICLFAIHGPLSPSDPIIDFARVYPPLCLLLGGALCAHGGFYSGRWLVVGGVYFPLAVLMSVMPPGWRPLVFCLVSTVVALLAARELRRDAQQSS